MTKLASELDLPYLDIEKEWFAEDPFPHFTNARKKHPWLASCSIGYTITEKKAMKEIIRDNDQRMAMGLAEVVEYMGAVGTPWGNFVSNSIQDQTGENHKRLRDVLRSSFSPAQANKRRDLMREVLSDVIDEWAPKGAFDFGEFSSNFPVAVMCRIIGASPEAIPDLKSSLEAMGRAFSMDRKNLPWLNEAVGTLYQYVEKLVADRRQGHRTWNDVDLLDHLLETTSRGEISDDELHNLLIFLFVAGFDTSKNVLTFIMYQMLRHPEVYARCAEDKDYCRKVMNETFRYHAPASAVRKVVEDVEFRGVMFPAGTIINFPWSVSGRCPSAAQNPDVFDVERTDSHAHTAFGLGAHICLGQFLARAQIEEGLHIIAQRIKNPRPAGPHGWRPFPGVWGIDGLPIKFDLPAEAAGK